MEWACCQSSRPPGSPDPASKARRKCACFRRLLRWICWNCGSRGDLGRARNGWLIMRVHHGEAESKSALLDRRDWLRLMLGGVIGSGGGTATARSTQSPAKETQSPAKDKGAPRRRRRRRPSSPRSEINWTRPRSAPSTPSTRHIMWRSETPPKHSSRRSSPTANSLTRIIRGILIPLGSTCTSRTVP